MQGVPHEARPLDPARPRCFAPSRPRRRHPHLALRQHLHQRCEARPRPRAASWSKAATSPWSKAPGSQRRGRARVQPCRRRRRRAQPAPARSTPAEQKARDADARLILEAELKKAEARQAELLKEWNNGEPEKLGPEHRNHQKYLDRVAELKATIARNESDIAGIQRELGRMPGGAAAAVAK